MIFLVCPVRGASPAETAAIREYVARLEAAGAAVYWPARDTDQGGDGLAICLKHREVIEAASEIHVWWSPGSEGSRFDLGMAFALRKPVRLANRVEPTPTKSFANVLRAIGLPNAAT